MRAPDSWSCPEEASASELAQEGFWFLWDVLSCLSGPGGLSCRCGMSCIVCLALEGFPVIVGCPVLSVWPWRAFLSLWEVLSCLSGPGGLSCRCGMSCIVCLALEGFPVVVGCPVLSVGPWRAVLSCFVLSCLFSPGGLLIPPHFPMDILGGVVEFRL